MPLSTGDKLGPYEITAPLGAGGMGEVYKTLSAHALQRTERAILTGAQPALGGLHLRRVGPGAGLSPGVSGAPGQVPDLDGRELFFVSPEGKLMAAELKVGADSVAPSTPRELFAVAVGSGLYSPYAVAPDGKRSLVRVPVGGSQPLEVVVDWKALLKKGAVPE